MDNLEFDGEEISGLARCPFDAKQTNVALFAGMNVFTNNPIRMMNVFSGVCVCVGGGGVMKNAMAIYKADMCVCNKYDDYDYYEWSAPVAIATATLKSCGHGQ